MLINGVKYTKEEMEHQIIYLKETIQYNKEQLKIWTKALKKEEKNK